MKQHFAFGWGAREPVGRLSFPAKNPAKASGWALRALRCSPIWRSQTCNQQAKGGSRNENQITLVGDESGLVIDPELLAQDPEAFKKTLIEQVRVRGGTRLVHTKKRVPGHLKQTLEAFLEVERED